MIELYEVPLSGNSHKVRLLLSLLGLEYRSHKVELAAGEHKSAAHLQRNPFGQVPVLEDGDTVIRDSQAILVYLARAYGGDIDGRNRWYPNDPVKAAQISAWLSTAANEVARGPVALRAHHKFGRAIQLADAEAVTASLLTIVDAELRQRDWLVGEQVSIADIALYPYLALAEEGRVDLSLYPHIQAWLARIERLPGFTSMPGIRLQSAVPA
jgi:glutathione S-transferase